MEEIQKDWDKFYQHYLRYKKWPLRSIKKAVKEKGELYLKSLLLIIKEQKENKAICKVLVLRLSKWLKLRKSWFEFQSTLKLTSTSQVDKSKEVSFKISV